MRASIEDEVFGEHDEQRDEHSRVASHLHSNRRSPTASEAMQFKLASLTSDSEEGALCASAQYSQVTIGLGRTRFLGRKKLDQFLCIHLGLCDELLDMQDLPAAPVEDELSLTDDFGEGSFYELETDDDPSMN